MFVPYTSYYKDVSSKIFIGLSFKSTLLLSLVYCMLKSVYFYFQMYLNNHLKILLKYHLDETRLVEIECLNSSQTIYKM